MGERGREAGERVLQAGGRPRWRVALRRPALGELEGLKHPPQDRLGRRAVGTQLAGREREQTQSVLRHQLRAELSLRSARVQDDDQTAAGIVGVHG